MKRKSAYLKAIAWADREARLTMEALKKANLLHKRRTEGWLSACYEIAWLAGYRAAKREGRKGEL